MRWGILGTGGIANAFAEALHDVPDAELAAVGSRFLERAEGFAARHDVPLVRDYASLVADDQVDVIYVASPASHHYRHARLALEAGRHVLVEKAFTVNVEQAVELHQLSMESGLFCMEAMWSRFTPGWTKLRELLRQDVIGEVLSVHAAWGGRAVVDPQTRPFRHDLGGGALLDAVVYPVSFATMILGTPGLVRAVGRIDPETGVDHETTVLVDFDGRTAVCAGAMTTTLDSRAVVYGTEGMIVLPGGFINPAYLDVLWPGKEPLHVDFQLDKHRLAAQIDEAGFRIVRGEHESAIMSQRDSLRVMDVLDEARGEIGLRYPEDVEAA